MRIYDSTVGVRGAQAVNPFHFTHWIPLWMWKWMLAKNVVVEVSGV